MTGTEQWFGGSSLTTAPPEVAWAGWTDPSCWIGGPIEEARLHGAFEVGGKYVTRVKGERRLTATITHMEEPRLWVSVAKAPGLVMTIEHLIEPMAEGTLLTERLRFSGPLAPLVSRLMGRRLRRTFAATTAHAAQVAAARVE
jgi:hypothetical protein